jgi:hypothetical protein
MALNKWMKFPPANRNRALKHTYDFSSKNNNNNNNNLVHHYHSVSFDRKLRSGTSEKSPDTGKIIRRQAIKQHEPSRSVRSTVSSGKKYPILIQMLI